MGGHEDINFWVFIVGFALVSLIMIGVKITNGKLKYESYREMFQNNKSFFLFESSAVMLFVFSFLVQHNILGYTNNIIVRFTYMIGIVFMILGLGRKERQQ